MLNDRKLEDSSFAKPPRFARERVATTNQRYYESTRLQCLRRSGFKPHAAYNCKA